jgi:two-component system nitrogen regulation response regulator NtrX
MTQVRQSIAKVAPTGSRVLISGPAGSGKEVVARQIHQASHRALGPFVVMNCATMHPDRFESELFGVAAGFEAADSQGRIGTFERAHGGTLFLDEVADMPLETQGKIVRALQDSTFTRVGGDRRLGVDVRVIAATNRNLPELIVEGRFREDLYYRLNVVPLTVLPLRQHREDIPDLCNFFMHRAAEAAGVPPRRINEDAIATLQAYDWPGNARQLRNVVDWIVIMAPGHPEAPVGPDQLPAEVGIYTPASLTGQRNEEIMAMPLRDAREVFERQYLEAQVMRFSGNISRTASFVGMERSALHRKLRSLGITTIERN